MLHMPLEKLRLGGLWGAALFAGAISVAIPRARDSPGLDGYCPVALARQWRWVKGDRQYHVSFEGRPYWMESEAAAFEFAKSPEEFAPVFGGRDLLVKSLLRFSTPGRRDHGVRYRGRVWLFASEKTLREFAANPAMYAALLAKGPSSKTWEGEP